MTLLPCQKQRVLVVDDDEAVRRTLRQVLVSELPGVTIDVATNGMEAMKIFHVEHHAVVLIDLFMPVMNGEQAYRGIEQMCAREKWEMPAVIFCTAHNPSREVRNFVTSNSNHHFLQKPVKVPVLVDVIRSRLAVSEPGSETASEPAPAPPGPGGSV